MHHCVLWARMARCARVRGRDAGDGSWLGTLRGKCAVGGALFCATDAGLVRVEHRQGRLEAVREFPDAEPFVDAGCGLLLSREGLTVVGPQDLTVLRMN